MKFVFLNIMFLLLIGFVVKDFCCCFPTLKYRAFNFVNFVNWCWVVNKLNELNNFTSKSLLTRWRTRGPTYQRRRSGPRCWRPSGSTSPTSARRSSSAKRERPTRRTSCPEKNRKKEVKELIKRFSKNEYTDKTIEYKLPKILLIIFFYLYGNHVNQEFRLTYVSRSLLDIYFGPKSKLAHYKELVLNPWYTGYYEFIMYYIKFKTLIQDNSPVEWLSLIGELSPKYFWFKITTV